MTRKGIIWEVRFALGQIGLGFKHGVDTVVSIFTLNARGLNERCATELDAFIAKMNAQRP
jgi:hypothetical protein